jgi:hypothetical protein
MASTSPDLSHIETQQMALLQSLALSGVICTNKEG